MYGSVRGTVSNDRPYRDSQIGGLGCCLDWLLLNWVELIVP